MPLLCVLCWVIIACSFHRLIYVNLTKQLPIIMNHLFSWTFFFFLFFFFSRTLQYVIKTSPQRLKQSVTKVTAVHIPFFRELYARLRASRCYIREAKLIEGKQLAHNAVMSS